MLERLGLYSIPALDYAWTEIGGLGPMGDQTTPNIGDLCLTFGWSDADRGSSPR